MAFFNKRFVFFFLIKSHLHMYIQPSFFLHGHNSYNNFKSVKKSSNG